jgi:ATP-dependent phosphofructokinase / diphosphate-dependent phosphofructokinase
MPEGGEMVFMGGEKDMFGHAKLGGIGQNVSNKVKELAPGYNGGKKIDMISMNLSYLVRSGAPDAIDCIVPTAYGNLAVDLIKKGQTGRMVALQGGKYGSVPIDEVVSTKKVVDVDRYYDTERYRPRYDALELSPLMVLGGSE